MSNVDIDEAVNYGFDMFKGVAKYIIYIFLLNGLGFFLFVTGRDEGVLVWIIGIPLIIAGIILNIALSIGIIYKLWVDIISRARQ